MPDLVIYDKAKYHYEGKFPEGVDRGQAFVYPGIYFGWICGRQLSSPLVAEDFRPELARFMDRNITGPTLFRLLGGTLASDMLSLQGNRFTETYYSSRYLDDYNKTLGSNLPTLYHVQDTWSNFDLIAQIFDRRFNEWLNE